MLQHFPVSTYSEPWMSMASRSVDSVERCSFGWFGLEMSFHRLLTNLKRSSTRTESSEWFGCSLSMLTHFLPVRCCSSTRSRTNRSLGISSDVPLVWRHFSVCRWVVVRDRRSFYASRWSRWEQRVEWPSWIESVGLSASVESDWGQPRRWEPVLIDRPAVSFLFASTDRGRTSKTDFACRRSRRFPFEFPATVDRRTLCSIVRRSAVESFLWTRHELCRVRIHDRTEVPL